tara:strand:- start:1507 stop:1755 length:249 start_codon:yes stop_codon:yes gene_type:complete
MKRKKNITKKDMIDMIRQVTTMSLANKKTLDMLGEFLYNYLDMKGDTKEYTKFMEDKIDGLLKQSSKGNGEVSRESLQEEEE